MKSPRHLMFMMHPLKRIRADNLFFGAVFLFGAVLGYIAGALVSDNQHVELSDYLLSYSRVASAGYPASATGVAFAYFRLPVAVCLVSFAAFGIWLIPVLVAGQGFLLAFSIRCFTEALGRGGALLSLVSMGIRCLFVLPCVFYLSCRGLKEIMYRRKDLHVRERAERPPVYPLLICFVVLLIGCILDATFSPRLFTLILNHHF